MQLSLVTGGAGFIGSNMVKGLLESGQRVRVLDDFSTGKRENLAGLRGPLEVIEGDVRDNDAVLRAVSGVNVVYHLAALGSVPQSLVDPRTTHDVNVTGTFNVLNACRELLVRRLVFASSSAVYGSNTTLPQHEDLPLAPISPYGASKAIAEVYCRAFAESYGLETFCLRYFNVFGPQQDPHSHYAAAIPLFVSALLRGEAPTIFDDGEQSRGFTYVSDIVRANRLAAEAGNARGQAVNISLDAAITVNHTVRCLRELLGKMDIEPRYAPPRAGDIKFSRADVSRARSLLGFEAQVSFEDGLREAIDWYREHLGKK